MAAILFSSVAGAEGAQRYAAPGGSGTTCSQAAPCLLMEAAENAGAGDEVIVAAGNYTETTQIQVLAANVSIHGPASGPKPVLTTSGGPGLSLVGNSGAVSDLRIVHNAGFSAINVASNSSATRVEAISSGGSGCSVLNFGLIRDSLCASTAPSPAAGVFQNPPGSSTAALRNVTAVGPTGVGVSANAGATVSMDLRNVIAVGKAGPDISANNFMPTASITLGIEYSNYDLLSPPTMGTFNGPSPATNQTAPPVFANAASGDFHQAPSSPTIDAGAADGSTGTSDFEQDLRPLGNAIDIGADEFVPVPDATPPVPDTTPPQTTIDKGPKKRATPRKATFTFSADEAGATFECKLDKGSYEACTSPTKYKRLKKGKHKFAVRAKDAAGNVDASPAILKWKVKKKPTK